MPRTENDTWDLASSVGATATGVAAARALASLGESPLIDDPFAGGSRANGDDQHSPRSEMQRCTDGRQLVHRSVAKVLATASPETVQCSSQQAGPLESP